MAPNTKKRKRNNVDKNNDQASIQQYHCTSCVTDRIADRFPICNPTPDCNHLINTCKACLSQWVSYNVAHGLFVTSNGITNKNNSSNKHENNDPGKFVFGIKCPECDSTMTNANVEPAAAKKVYQRFEWFERKFIAENTPGWRWCLSSSCSEGQVHPTKDPTTDKANGNSNNDDGDEVTIQEEDGTWTTVPENKICICHSCGAKACVSCDRPWHEGETCKQYQIRIKDRVKEEDLALKTIAKVTSPCPNCNRNIQKNGGCSMVFCFCCKEPFCWDCRQLLRNNPQCKCIDQYH